MSTQPNGPHFLPTLYAAFKKLEGKTLIETKEFTSAYEAIFPIFEHLGTVFSFAKHELEAKLQTIKKAGEEGLETLDVIVAKDRKAGVATIKDSCTRNIHRLLAGIMFIASLLRHMAGDRTMSLRIAAGTAYDENFATMHTWLVRTGVKAALYMLPTREYFLSSIGETEETARKNSADLIPTVTKVVKHIETYYAGIKMPASTTTSLSQMAPPQPAHASAPA